MRTPLNALRLGIQAARTSQDPEVSQSALEIAQRNVEALSAMVESLVDVGIRERGELSLKSTSPLDLVASAIDQITLIAKQKNLRVIAKETDALPPVVADSSRLTRVLVNLLSNAVRFSRPDEIIVVDVKLRSNDGHEVMVFSVSDEGPGVSAADVDRIFMPGVSIANGGNPSNGLGLAVCKEIIEAHGGRIWVETGKSHGATFSFSVPTNLQVSAAGK